MACLLGATGSGEALLVGLLLAVPGLPSPASFVEDPSLEMGGWAPSSAPRAVGGKAERKMMTHGNPAAARTFRHLSRERSRLCRVCTAGAAMASIPIRCKREAVV